MRRLTWVVLALAFVSAAYVVASNADCHTDSECGCGIDCN